VHCFAITAFLAFNNVQKSQSNNDRCCLKVAAVAIGIGSCIKRTA